MNLKKQEELQENLVFLRERFDELNQKIELPHSLSADALLSKLENLDTQKEPLRANFHRKTWVGMAACFVLICGSAFGIWQMNGQSGALPEMAEASAAPRAVVFSLDENPATGGNTEKEKSRSRLNNFENTESSVKDVPMEAALDMGSALFPGKMLDTIEKAKAESPYGIYLPEDGTLGLKFVEGYLSEQSLSALYDTADGLKELQVEVLQANEQTYAHIADVNDPKTYDLREYTIPYAQSVPVDLWWVVNDVVFQKEQVTLPLVEARILPHQDVGDFVKQSGQLSILMPDGMVVRYRTVNIAPEELFSLIQAY